MSVDLQGLNPNQKEAVLSNNKYIRVIAGAGSGKTRVLITRIAYLIEEKKVYPNKILAITFTNKAANEMKERIKKQLGNDQSTMWISTIHSLCVRILREDILCMGYPRNFTVMDQDDQKMILKEAYKEFDIDKNKISYSSMLDYIANNKAADITFEHALTLAGQIPNERNKANVYKFYTERQLKLYALDFDDLLLWTVKMFKKFPEVQEKWSRRFNYIHVDEFQDIDEVQYQLIKQLGSNNNSIYVVGDPDQTIYSWRGADVNIIMGFEKDFEDVKTIVLNENYRSTQSILNGANQVIKNNNNRVEKELFTKNNIGDKITHYSSAGDEYEASWVANKINEAHDNGASYLDMAILYRSNYQSRPIEKALLEAHIPYIIYGGIKFYERAEIKDALCYLRMLTTADDLAFQRVINVPKRGLGNKSIDTISDKAKSENISYYEVIKEFKLLSGKNQKALDDFVELIEKIKRIKDTVSLSKLLEMVLDMTGYRAMLQNDNETERIENLKELINDLKSFEVTYPDSTLDEYLQVVSLYGDKSDYEQGNYVQLMTVHAAKGLEFDTVFVFGMSDGIFPSERSMQEGRKGLEEERRLAYVAFTRARKKLYLTESTGFSYILQKVRTKSRFINEIDDEFVQHVGANFEYGKPKDIQLSSELFKEHASFEERIEKTTKVKYKKGDIVTHGVFGEGVVISESEGILQIAFAYPHGVKKIMANHPSITKVEKKLS